MTTKKIAVTVPEEILEKARSSVHRGKARSLSAYVSEALAEKLVHEELDTLLQEMLAESGGPLTARERRQADRDLDGPRPKRRSR